MRRWVVIKIIEEIYDFWMKNFMVLLKVIAANSEWWFTYFIPNEQLKKV